MLSYCRLSTTHAQKTRESVLTTRALANRLPRPRAVLLLLPASPARTHALTAARKRRATARRNSATLRRRLCAARRAAVPHARHTCSAAAAPCACCHSRAAAACTPMPRPTLRVSACNASDMRSAYVL